MAAKGIAKYDKKRSGLNKNKLLGINSAVIKTIIVDIIVWNNRTKKSFFIIIGKESKIIGSSNWAIKIP